MNNLRACWRLLRVLGHILKGLAIVAVRFPALSPDQQHARVQAWSMQLLARAGMSLRRPALSTATASMVNSP